MIVPAPACRPNPARAIYIQGLIDQGLVDKLTPQIIKLTSESRAPITVYIDSRGGSVASAELLLKLLTASDQELSGACKLITVVTSWAASAAADLLSSGNYALAYPESTILYHGVRSSFRDPVTVEAAAFLVENLKVSNDRYAMALARRTEWRFMFRFMTMRPQFDDYRKKPGCQELGELDCFLALTREKLSTRAKKILEQAGKRYHKYNSLLLHALKFLVKRRKSITSERLAERESVMLRGIINYEVQANKSNLGWTFRDGGLTQLQQDFLLLQEYLASAQSPQFKELCKRWSTFVLTEQEKADLEKLTEEEKAKKELEIVQPHFQPVWSFFVALCHVLQEGENELSATDAFWLGLIDEIIGVGGLPCFRYIEEFEPDPEPKKDNSEPSKNGIAEKA